jgi:hypothetical protein
MNNDQIIQKIKTENVQPISKNVFLVRKITVWLMFAVSTIFGAYAFAFFFLKTLYVDFDDWYYFSNTYNGFLFKNIPILWLMLFVLSILAMFLIFKKTGKGYRYSILFLAAISLVISFSLGLILSKVLAYKDFFTDRFENERFMDWTNPKSGRLSGEVLYINDQYIILRDIKDNIWNVDVRYLIEDSKQTLEQGQIVSIVGHYDFEGNFTACQVMPFHMNHMRFKPSHDIVFDQTQEESNDSVRDICNFVMNSSVINSK